MGLEVWNWKVGIELNKIFGHALGGGIAVVLQKWPWTFGTIDLRVNSKDYKMIYSNLSCTSSRSLWSIDYHSVAITIISIPIDIN